MDKKDKKIEEILNKLNQDMAIAYLKSSLSRKKVEDESYLYFVLISWFKNIKTVEDFNNKYHCFNEVYSIIEDSLLFNMVVSISIKDDKDEELIDKGINVYNEILKNPDYVENSKKSGYKLPSDFGNKDNYYNNSLVSKVKFYNSFNHKLKELNKDIQRGGLLK